MVRVTRRPLVNAPVRKPVTDVQKAVASLRLLQQARFAAAQRRTLSKRAVEQGKRAATTIKAATRKKVATVLKKSSSISSKKAATVKAKAVKSAEAAKARAMEQVQARSSKLARQKEAAQQQARSNLEVTATVIQITKSSRQALHQSSLEANAKGQIRDADKVGHALDINRVSGVRALKETGKPVGNTANRGTFEGGQLQQVEGISANLSRETATRDAADGTVVSEGANSISAKAKAERAGRDATAQQTNMGITDRARTSLRGQLKEVSPDLIAKQAKEFADSRAARTTASTQNSAKQAADTNRTGAAARADGANLGRSHELSSASKYDAAARNAETQRNSVERQKAEVEAGQEGPLPQNVADASAYRDSTGSDYTLARESHSRQSNEYDSRASRRSAAEQDQSGIDSQLASTEPREAGTRAEYNKATEDYNAAKNDVADTSAQLATTGGKINALEPATAAAYVAAENARPGSSETRTRELTRQEDLEAKMQPLFAKIFAIKNRLYRLMQVQRAMKPKKDGNDAALARDRPILEGARDKLASAQGELPVVKKGNARQDAAESKFNRKSKEQRDQIYQKTIQQRAIQAQKMKLQILDSTGVKKPTPGDVRENAGHAGKAGAKLHDAALNKALLESQGRPTLRKDTTDADIAAANKKFSEAKQENDGHKARLDAEMQKKLDSENAARDSEQFAKDALANKDKTDRERAAKEAELPPNKDAAEIIQRENSLRASKELENARKTDSERQAAQRSKETSQERADDADSRRNQEDSNADAYEKARSDAEARAIKAEQDRIAAERAGEGPLADDAKDATDAREGAQKNAEDAAEGNARARDEHAAANDARKQAEDAARKNDDDTDAAERDHEGAGKDKDDAEAADDLATFNRDELVKAEAASKAKISDLEKQAKAARQNADSIYPHSSERRAELKAEADALDAQLNDARKRLKDINDAMDALKQKEAEFAKLSKERDSLRDEDKALQKELEDNLLTMKRLENDMEDALRNGNTTQYNSLKAQLARLSQRNQEIITRRAAIRSRLNEIARDFDLRRLQEENNAKLKKIRDEKEALDKLEKGKADHDAYVAKMLARVEYIGGWLGFILGMTIPLIILQMMRTPTGTPTPVEPPTDTPTETDTPEPPSGPSAANPWATPPDLSGNTIITTYPPNPPGTQVIFNLYCASGTSDYLRGCKDGALKGVADGKMDGAKDQVANATRILPLTKDQIGILVDTLADAFNALELQAYCTEIMNEGEASGMTTEEVYSLYPQCKNGIPKYGPRSSGPKNYGEYGPKNYGPKNYGPKDYGEYGPYGPRQTQSGGDISRESQDYLEGWVFSYATYYLQSYHNAWAISKQMMTPAPIPLVIRPFPLVRIRVKNKYGYGYGYGYGEAMPSGPIWDFTASGPSAPSGPSGSEGWFDLSGPTAPMQGGLKKVIDKTIRRLGRGPQVV